MLILALQLTLELNKLHPLILHMRRLRMMCDMFLSDWLEEPSSLELLSVFPEERLVTLSFENHGLSVHFCFSEAKKNPVR